MKFAPALQKLIDALRILPGVGPKSAQRMAFILLEDQQGATQLAQAVQQALTQIKSCSVCRNYTQADTCEICAEPARSEQAAICVVAQPQDVLSIEQTGHFHGRYFVLKGLLSPIDGIGPEELGLDSLQQQLQDGISEVILATSPSVEGEATAFYISEMAKKLGISVTRLAQGLPAGGELSSLDSRTLGHAFSGRKQL